MPAWMEKIPGSEAAEWAKKRREAQQVIDQEYAKYVQEMNRMRDATLSTQDSERRALVARYNPDAARLAQARADRDSLLRLGTRDEASQKALSALNKEIAALEKGYKNAGAAASALSKAQREAQKAANEAERKAAREKRDADDLALRRLREDVTIARIGGDASVIATAEQELRLREMIIQRERDGVSASAARLEAERQISRELLAQYATLKVENSDATLEKQGFMSSEARMAKALAEMGNVKAFSAKTALFEDLRLNTRQAFGDGLMEAAEGGSFFSVFASRLKSAAASALVGIATDGLFGNRDGSKTGLISSAMTFFLPKNKYAHGTPSSAAGLALVGEKGPELVNLPGGSRVHTADDTMRKLTSMASAAMAPAAPMVSITYAPVLNAQGAGPREVDELKAMMARQQAEFEGRVINTVQEAVGRRTLRVG